MELVTVSQLAEILGVCRVTIYRRIASGDLPKPLYVGKRSPRWREDDIRQWIAALAAVA